MLRKITFNRYLITSSVVILISYIYQLSLHQDCAWDGCYPAHGNTYIGSLFGLPVFMLWPILFIGLLIFALKARAKARH
jgi:hypothetical protein